MTHKTALIIDPEWRLQPPPVDINHYQAHVKTELGKLPPTDFLMTACSRDDEYWVPTLFQTATNWQYPANAGYMVGIPSPHFPNNPNEISRWNRKCWLNHRIMSNKLTELDKKTKQYTRIATAIPINTASGLINATAGNDAITRMLTNTKHKIDQIVIIDPYKTIGNTSLSNWYNRTSIMHETLTAWAYAQLHPSIPCAVIV